MSTVAASEAAAHAARTSYGRLVAYLAWRWNDLAGAEDALGEALLKALQRWPREGVPEQPEGWLLTVARRELLQTARHARVAERLSADPLLSGFMPGENEPAPPPALTPDALPDHRLRLMLACAHPAIDPQVRSALMLQAVLGLDARRIASAFLVSPTAMAQRLVRAKQKISRAGIRFEEPSAADWPERIHAVLEAVYAAYGLAWGVQPHPAEADDTDAKLAAEALYLAELCVALLPHEPEARGLWALLLFCESRRAARYQVESDGTQRFVPLLEQEVDRWDHECIAQAERQLHEAAALGRLGPYQLEAAIQSAHAQRARGRPVPWDGIAQLYEALLQIAPTWGAKVGHAVALGTAHGAEKGLARLDGLPASAINGYAPYWVARSHLLEAAGRWSESADACQRGLGLTADPRLRSHLWHKAQALRAATVTAPTP